MHPIFAVYLGSRAQLDIVFRNEFGNTVTQSSNELALHPLSAEPSDIQPQDMASTGKSRCALHAYILMYVWAFP